MGDRSRRLRVALALAQLIKTQHPGDALKAGCSTTRLKRFRSPNSRARRPYYTNTREGLRLARRILDRQWGMRQIIMITDGKPSLTQPDGRIYKNAFGLDPFIVARCAEVAACRKSAS
jgi:Ca-activated chloride channel family protein